MLQVSWDIFRYIGIRRKAKNIVPKRLEIFTLPNQGNRKLWSLITLTFSVGIYANRYTVPKLLYFRMIHLEISNCRVIKILQQ